MVTADANQNCVTIIRHSYLFLACSLASLISILPLFRAFLDKLNNVNNPSSIHTCDFSTLYTNLPLDLVRNELYEMIDRYFDINE